MASSTYPLSRPRSTGRPGHVRPLWLIATSLLWLGLLAAAPGLLLRDSLLVGLAGALLPLAFLIYDLAGAHSGRITAMTAYEGAAALTSLANVVALLNANTPQRWKYYLYVSDSHVFVAMCLELAASTLPPLAFYAISASKTAAALQGLLPKARAEVADRNLVLGGSTIGILAVIVHWQFPSVALGTLDSIVFLAPLFVAFVLARAATERHVPGALASALLVATAESIRALLLGYLRGDVAAPFIALVLGALTGARSLRPLKSPIFLPIYGALIVFTVYFGAFGAIRGDSGGGLQRLQAMQAYQQNLGEEPGGEDQTVLSRLTTINQLSQVGRLVDDEGYLHGQTLNYLAYAFVPRFLWRDKPVIAKGSWFALKLGLAYVRNDGRISNSINMTIPGELYLNFGWIGVFVGLVFIGAFIATFWRVADFWSSPRNVLGTAFAFYLMWPWIGFSLGADLQICVTIIAVYLLLVAVGWILGSLRRRHNSPPLTPLQVGAA